MKIYNSLTKNLEEFTPLNPGQVGMYTCGPTVYDFQHIGNFRTMIFSDILCRTLRLNGYQVKSVRNITDIDDKIIKRAKERNLSISELSKEYEEGFFTDLTALNVSPVDVSPHATEHIGKMIKYIEELIVKGFAYVEDDGSVYFDISKFPEYGRLSGLDKRELKTGTRVLSDEYTKENIQDFALWKGAEEGEMGYDSPWGKGRPGWHIECSVMSQEYLGDTFDIHAGGIDLLFPHHENEIAQAEAKTGQRFVNYFIHGEHILVDNQKMSKSLNNFFKLSDLTERGFDPLALRYLYLTGHYREKMNFTFESLQAAQNALNNLRSEVRNWSKDGEVVDEYKQKFLEALNNDLNTPQALAVMWEMSKSDLSPADKGATILWMDSVLGLDLDKYVGEQIEIPEVVWGLVHEREEARKNKNFEKSDQLRDQISELGFEVLDTAQGPQLKSKTA